MSVVVYIGWHYNMFISDGWSTVGASNVGEIIAMLLFWPMTMVYVLFIALPLESLGVSSPPLLTGAAVVYGLVASPAISWLLYAKWHRKKRMPTSRW